MLAAGSGGCCCTCATLTGLVAGMYWQAVHQSVVVGCKALLVVMLPVMTVLVEYDGLMHTHKVQALQALAADGRAGVGVTG